VRDAAHQLKVTFGALPVKRNFSYRS